MGGSIVGVHRHQGIAITMLLIHHVERAIALRDTSALLCALMDRMMSFPARLVQWCGYWAKSAKMTIVGRNRTVAGGALGSGWKSIEKRLQMALLSAPWGPNSTTKQKSQKMVRKLFRPSWSILAIGRMPHTGKVDRKVGTATILSSPRTYRVTQK